MYTPRNGQVVTARSIKVVPRPLLQLSTDCPLFITVNASSDPIRRPCGCHRDQPAAQINPEQSRKETKKDQLFPFRLFRFNPGFRRETVLNVTESEECAERPERAESEEMSRFIGISWAVRDRKVRYFTVKRISEWPYLTLSVSLGLPASEFRTVLNQGEKEVQNCCAECSLFSSFTRS